MSVTREQVWAAIEIVGKNGKTFQSTDVLRQMKIRKNHDDHGCATSQFSAIARMELDDPTPEKKHHKLYRIPTILPVKKTYPQRFFDEDSPTIQDTFRAIHAAIHDIDVQIANLNERLEALEEAWFDVDDDE